MLTILFSLIAFGLTAYALWSSSQGEGPMSVEGSGNSFDSYYGKSRFDPGQSPPCPDCERIGCIGAGTCFCRCHRAHKKKK